MFVHDTQLPLTPDGLLAILRPRYSIGQVKKAKEEEVVLKFKEFLHCIEGRKISID